MAYADQKMGSSRIVALVVVALIHAVIGYAFVTGLAYKYVKEVQEELETFEVEEPPPPPEQEEPPPPPPEEVATQPPPVVTPPPIVKTATPPPVQIQAVRTPPTNYVPIPVAAPPAPAAPVAPPAPPAPKISKKARAKGNLGRFFGQDNYPPSALRAEAEGRATFRIGIGTNGRVTSCEVTSSTGNDALDDATCRGARRATFEPALDDAGRPIASTLTQSITWQIER